MRDKLGLPDTARIGMAVSGGGDSMALLHMVAGDWPKEQIFVATVDHGLRAEAGAEAAFVARTCADLGLAHQVLSLSDLYDGPDLQARARAARYDALAQWGRELGLDAILLGHTCDDVAEGFLIRLARGSGVDGLAAMAQDWTDRGCRWMRPLLAWSRDDLRDYLQGRGQTWVEDPSNQDTRFERIRMRHALPDLAQIGLDQSRLSGTAHTMARAREALNWAAQTLAQDVVRLEFGAVLIDRVKCADAPQELVHRLFSAALQWVGGQAYRPRYKALKAAYESDRATTLAGCLIFPHGDGVLYVAREFAAVERHAVERHAVERHAAQAGQIWDNRWQIDAPAGSTIRALGDYGRTQWDGWRDVNTPTPVLLSTPALWNGDDLVQPITELRYVFTHRYPYL